MNLCLTDAFGILPHKFTKTLFFVILVAFFVVQGLLLVAFSEILGLLFI